MTKGSAQNGPNYNEKVIYNIVLVKKTIVFGSVTLSKFLLMTS